MQQNQIWINTISDQSIPFYNYTDLMKEQQKKELAKVKLLGTSGFKMNTTVNSEDELFQLQEVAYYRELNIYVQIKKFDEDKNVYDVRVIDPSAPEQQEVVKNVSPQRLSRRIDVHVKSVQKENKSCDQSSFSVAIHDKISKILSLLQMDQVGGGLIRNNNLLKGEADLDKTFAKSFVKDGEKFALLPVNSSKKWPEPQKWRRCREPLEHCFEIRPNQNDAITFIPKSPVYFMGFGQMQNRSSQDMNLQWSWTIGDNKSDWYSATILNDNMDTKNHWTEVRLIENLNIQPIKVDEGVPITIIVQSQDKNYPVWLVVYGSEDDQKNMEGQEFDFLAKSAVNVQDSHYTCENHGQIPFILYNKV